MRARGFTILELATVLTITTLLLPIVATFGRTFEAEHRDAVDDVAAAREMRGLSEELRRDLRTRALAGEAGLALDGPGDCGHVEYVLSGDVLERRAAAGCGGTRAVAAHVGSVSRLGSRLVVAFAHHAGRDVERVTAFEASLPPGPRR